MLLLCAAGGICGGAGLPGGGVARYIASFAGRAGGLSSIWIGHELGVICAALRCGRLDAHSLRLQWKCGQWPGPVV